MKIIPAMIEITACVERYAGIQIVTCIWLDQ